MAEVHVGRDTRLGRTVAIKVLRSDLARDPAFQARFRREAQAAASLNHPAIVAVYDTGEDASTDANGAPVRVPYIIMEYVEGHTLRDRLREVNAVPIDEAIEITVGVLQALQYAHHAGIVHRDIKPANIMLATAGQVKVMDFGIARALSDTAATMTQTQAVIGTAQYLSPEQARGETVDARSDLYSTGCVLYELLTGRPPFVGDSAVAVAYQHVREMPVPPSSVASDVPEVLDRIVLKALAKDRDLRYATASEFRGDLEIAKRGGTVAASAVPPVLPAAGATQIMTPPSFPATGATRVGSAPTQAPPGLFPTPSDNEDDDDEGGRKRWVLIAAIAAVGVIALGAIIFFAMRGTGEPAPTPPPTSPSETASAEPTPVAIPEVTAGMTPEAAMTQLTALALEGVLEEIASDDVERGLVVGFDPPSRTRAAPGDTVKILVSTGPGELEVPDVSGMTQQVARDTLREYNLESGDVMSETSATVESGSVTRTEPEAFETVAAGSEVKLYISNGRTTVPNVKGKLLADARSDLEKAGLTVSEPQYKLSSEPPGTVLSQTPKANTETAQKDQVTLTIARAAEEITIASVLGNDQATAEETLVSDGLVPQFVNEYSDTVAVGLVTRTEPGPGNSATEGETVMVYVSQGPSPAPETPVIPPIETLPGEPMEDY
jgi:serine/threonine-protein kinase